MVILLPQNVIILHSVLPMYNSFCFPFMLTNFPSPKYITIIAQSDEKVNRDGYSTCYSISRLLENSNLGDGRFRVLLRNASTEDKENAASLKITLADFDGIAQVWYYIVMVTNGLDGIIIGELSTTGNYGGQLFISDAGIKYRKLSSGTYGAWNKLITNADFLTKIVSLNQVTVPANAGITGSTTNISGQIPSGYKLLDAREVGSGNNGCYIYYFKVDGTNITLQLRNVTNTEIKTSPAAQLLLIPK